MKRWKFTHDFSLPHDAYPYQFGPVAGDHEFSVGKHSGGALRKVKVTKVEGEPGSSQWVIEGYYETDDPQTTDDDAYESSWEMFQEVAYRDIEDVIWGVESYEGTIELAPENNPDQPRAALKQRLMPPV